MRRLRGLLQRLMPLPEKSELRHEFISGFIKADDGVTPYDGNEELLGKTVKS